MTDLLVRVGTLGRSSIMGAGLRTVTTSFPGTENPISESGLWTKRGLAEGTSWTDPRTTPGIFFGTQTGDGGTDDSIALVGGAWSNDQDVSGVVHLGTRPGSFSEIELLLRGTIVSTDAKLYECYFSVAASPNRYAHITRWEGAFNSYTDLASLDNSTSPTINDGDIIRATIVGGQIRVYVNGGQVMAYDTSGDSTKWTTGLPGLGVFSQTKASDSSYGWASATFKDYGA